MKKLTALRSYDNYPLGIVLLSNSLSIILYSVGLLVLLNLGIIFAVLYVLYILLIEFRLMAKSCRSCYYYGKLCAFGRGKCCGLLFSKGDPEQFVETEITMKDILPDFLVTIFPLVGGIIGLVSNFSWIIVVLLAVLVIFGFGGNALIRGSFACKYCKQRDIGCPAERLFNKEKN